MMYAETDINGRQFLIVTFGKNDGETTYRFPLDKMKPLPTGEYLDAKKCREYMNEHASHEAGEICVFVVEARLTQRDDTDLASEELEPIQNRADKSPQRKITLPKE